MRRTALALTLASLLVTVASLAEDMTFKPELENSEVRVVRIRVAPHQRIPMHEVPPHVAIWLTEAHLKITYPDGRTDVQRFSPGRVEWVTLGKHAGENVGSKAIEFIAVEPRRSPSPP
jgi:quercetin dioxygenase-like cupin family protein